MAKQHLINIAVGPVQEFIASARKLRDLWYGSFLLSELAKAVAGQLHAQGCELIFPAITDPKDLNPGSPLNVANKILALMPEGSDPAGIADDCRTAFRKRWQGICEDAKTRAERVVTLDQQMFAAQVADFGEFYAAWTPLEPDNYACSLERCGQLLAGRKGLREFSAPAWSGVGKPKSSLDGIRESVITGYTTSGRSAFQIKQGEELDALGIVKRFGPWNHPDRPHFDNLAQVAAEPFLAGLAESAGQDSDTAALISSLPSANELYPVRAERPPKTQPGWDGWPWETGPSTELLHPAVFEAEYREHAVNQAQDAWNRVRGVLQTLWKNQGHPSPYACLLVGDGDNMGKTLDRLQDMQAHQKFSRELENFARAVRRTVSDHGGQVVYSGGDDVMAYLPLHRVIDCARAINELFRQTMEQACAAGNVDIPTFSMGIAVVHMRMPLHRALDLARAAERMAKDQGRARLALVQSKRSGSDIIVHGHWYEADQLPPLPRRLTLYAEAYRRRLLSSRLAYQLRAIGKECGNAMQWLQGPGGLEPGNSTAAEALRLILHKQSGTKKIDLETALAMLAGQRSIRHFSDELVIAHQLSGAMELAHMPLPTD